MLQLLLLLWCCHLVVVDVVGLLLVYVVGDGVLPGCPLPAGLLGLVGLVLGPGGLLACPLQGTGDVVCLPPVTVVLLLLGCGLPWQPLLLCLPQLFVY